MPISELKVKTDLSAARLMSEEIADVLRENIISGNFNPGEKVNEYQIAKLLNISRPPIREAFRLLAAEGLITLVPRKGAFVLELSIREVKEIYEMKSMMESFAIRLAIHTVEEKKISEIDSVLNLMEKSIKENNFKKIQKLNIEFHRKIIEMSKNQKLIHFYESIILPIRKYQRLGLSAPSSWEVSLGEHRDIVKAIRSKNIELAEKLTREHTMRATLRVIEQLKRRKGS
ncbi:GntR family transcriptional regulator [Candidatus Aerophobetes bacterium]|nr:GntR family transcriptional regulator [Candidatus Aerophobetes bacterium]